jgi:hypothetical protein
MYKDFHTILHTHASNGAFVISTMIPTKHFRTAAMLLFHILQQSDVKEKLHFFRGSLPSVPDLTSAALVAFRLQHVRALAML